MMIHRGIRQQGLTSYAKGKRHYLTKRMKEVFLNRCGKLLNWIKANGSVIKFFSDERIFPVGRAFFRWDGHCIISSNKKVHHTVTTKYPAGFMANCVVSSECNVSNRFCAKRIKI